MAKHVLPEIYTFSPSTKTITITNRYLRQEQIMLITNVTRNTVIYNFSDPALGLASITNVPPTNSMATNTCTLVLNYNTTAMNAADRLAILVDEQDQSFTPSEVLTDPVNKFRTSSPQALIDTDFEYSTQATKWESLAMINNRPFAYYNTSSPITITGVNVTNNSRTVTVLTASPPSAGTPVYIQDTLWAPADGLFIVDSVSAGVSFSYTARIRYTASTGSIYDSSATIAYSGSVFSNASIGMTSIGYSGTAITVLCSQPHGLSVGNEIALTGTSASTNAPNGSWTVATVTNSTAFTSYVTNTPTGSITGGTLYNRPAGQILHRSFDGGVQFSTFAQSHNQQLIRQTRRYFRYQSGKGIQMSTGTILRPNINVDQITSSGTTVTVVCKVQHCINPGTTVLVAGCNETAYNGSFVVSTILDPYRFTYTAASVPSATTASGQYYLSVSSWYGATTRIGMFDNQNGIFFEFDGQTLYAVRRASTYQISGFANLVAGNNYVTGASINGVSTLFSKQLAPGDFIVVKGTSYRVENIASDTSMIIQPAYRGLSNLSYGVITKTIDSRVPQSSWNMDRMDGTGPSGLNLDIHRMQMFYMDYSWYGAGFIRWGFRGADGAVSYCHKMVNNNVNYEAYMRSGNLPARYETNTFANVTYITANVSSGDSVINVQTTSGWPSAGTLWVHNVTQSEFMNFTGKTATSFTGLTRGQAGGTLTVTTTANSTVLTAASTSGVQVGQFVYGTGIPENAFVSAYVTNTSVTLSEAATASGSISAIFAPLGQTAQAFTYSATAPISVELHSPQFAPTISHWGTSVIMDGRYDDDKSFVFTSGMTTALAIGAGATNVLMSFRIAPVVHNGVAGTAIGQRELINRMQMVLRQLDLFSNGQFLVTLVLNGIPSAGAWTNVGGSSLAQYINHAATTTISGGETIYGFYLNTSGGTTNYTTTSVELNLVRDLGNSILGGGGAAIAGSIYPNGPDVVSIVCRNLSASSSNVYGRLSWTEAQA